MSPYYSILFHSVVKAAKGIFAFIFILALSEDFSFLENLVERLERLKLIPEKLSKKCPHIDTSNVSLQLNLCFLLARHYLVLKFQFDIQRNGSLFPFSILTTATILPPFCHHFAHLLNLLPDFKILFHPYQFNYFPSKEYGYIKLVNFDTVVSFLLLLMRLPNLLCTN